MTNIQKSILSMRKQGHSVSFIVTVISLIYRREIKEAGNVRLLVESTICDYLKGKIEVDSFR